MPLYGDSGTAEGRYLFEKKIEGFGKDMEKAMRCPYLEKWSVWVCKARTNIYVPNYYEVFEYCKTKKHRKCDLFGQNYKGENTKIPISAQADGIDPKI